MKLIILFLLCSFYSFSQKSIKDELIGKWILCDSLQNGSLEFTSDGTFVMEYFFEESIVDSIEIRGDFVLDKTDVLFLKYGDNTAYEEYFIADFNGYSFILRYKEAKAKYVKKGNKC